MTYTWYLFIYGDVMVQIIGTHGIVQIFNQPGYALLEELNWQIMCKPFTISRVAKHNANIAVFPTVSHKQNVIMSDMTYSKTVLEQSKKHVFIYNLPLVCWSTF